jgi:octaheme c-type cytochrome (tetrathionate reductase family)
MKWFVGGVFALLSLVASTAFGAMDHSAMIQGPFEKATDVTKKCLQCHQKQADDFMKTVHWTWSETRGKVDLGKKNAINNFCVAVDSNWPRCTSCHAGYGWKDKSFDFTKAENVDCLVCHDTTGTYKKFPVGAGHPVYEEKEFPPKSGKKWKPLDLVKIAQNVGPTSRKTCGSCHFFGGGGDHVKHGDLDSSLIAPERRVDVHMGTDGANMNCSSCHKAKNHQIPGQALSVSAVDQGETLDCTNCHTEAPHKDSAASVYNTHAKKVACQSCHIPTFSRMLPTKVWWDWSTAGDKKRKPTKDEYGMKLYHPKKGDFKWAKDVVPTYAWFDGTVDRYLLGDKIDPSKVTHLASPAASKDTKGAKITPFKIMAGRQPYDAGTNMLGVPHLLKGYWKHYDWTKAVQDGQKVAGLPFKGPVEFTETDMYWKVNHMVVPKDQALVCSDCHGADGRMDWKALGYDGDPMSAKTAKK